MLARDTHKDAPSWRASRMDDWGNTSSEEVSFTWRSTWGISLRGNSFFPSHVEHTNISIEIKKLQSSRFNWISPFFLLFLTSAANCILFFKRFSTLGVSRPSNSRTSPPFWTCSLPHNAIIKGISDRDLNPAVSPRQFWTLCEYLSWGDMHFGLIIHFGHEGAPFCLSI